MQMEAVVAGALEAAYVGNAAAGVVTGTDVAALCATILAV